MLYTDLLNRIDVSAVVSLSLKGCL